MLFLAALVMISLMGCGGSNKETSKKVTLVSYEIQSIKEDMNITYGDTYGGQTYQANVVVKEPANKEQLKDVCRAVVTEVQKTYKDKADAIIVFIYDYPEYVGYGYTLGMAVQILDGSWQWEIGEKDWSKRLTTEEVEIWEVWHDLKKVKNAASPGAIVDEETVTDEVAEQYDVKKERVKEILAKQLAWSF
jgi:hypothetical protein